MSENLEKKPSKGILKSSSNAEEADASKNKQKETKWDEMNIIATLHPADKDYGHMKIEEPRTPYRWNNSDSSGEEHDGIDAKLLAEKIHLAVNTPLKVLVESSEDEESDDGDEESLERKVQRQNFERKRKNHYDEYHTIKLARKLMESDLIDDGPENTSHVDEQNIAGCSAFSHVTKGSGILPENDHSMYDSE